MTRSFPSVVHYGAEILVGREAAARGLDAPHATLASVKRLIGRGLKDVESVRAMLPSSWSVMTARCA